MLDTDRTLELFSLFSDLTGDALGRWRGLCEQACARLQKRLRPEIQAPADAELEQLHMAAAALAYSDYSMMVPGGTGSGGEIKVGDVTIKDTSAAREHSGTEIAAHFLEQAAGLLQPGQVFWRVDA